MFNKKDNKKLYRELFKNLLKDLSDELRQARVANKLTLEDVYWETNIFSKRIDLLESGRRFNIEILRQLAYYYRKKIKITLVNMDE